MRRSYINDKTQKLQFSKTGSRSHAQELNLQNFKLEPSRVPQNNFITSRAPLPYYHKAVKHLAHRPYTTQKNQSYLEYKRQSAGYYTNRHQQAKHLAISTMKEQSINKELTPSQENARFEHSRGRLYRGSSWKYDQKPIKDTYPMSMRYPAYQTNQSNLQKRDISQQQFNEHQHLKARKSGGLLDLLGQNLKKSEAKMDDNFFQYIMRFSYRTKKGYIPTNSGKVNQDSYIINPNLNSHTFQHFFSVCDGHGPLGHHVSNFIKNNLPNAVANSKGLERHPKEALTRAFETTYDKLLKQSNIDLSFSGSTIISCYFYQNRLFCANVGDSRAILGRCRSGSWETIALSNDHKPSVEKEAERIKKMKGRVQAFKDQYGESIGPLRVWVQNDNVPGLAMTRSFGDLVGASVGVSPIPEIIQFSLTEEDRIVVIGSDGVFEFLQNDMIIKSLLPFYQAKQIQQASDHLMSLATKSWNKNSSIIDDITFVLIFISYNEM